MTKDPNPYKACTKCGARVVRRPDNRNRPCGHHAPAESLCPTWTPPTGCTCPAPHDPPPTQGAVTRVNQRG